MTKKHARLASAVADAILAQGFTQKQVATSAGISQGSLSYALSGKYDIKEENWKMICENLGLDYEEVIADPEPETVPEAPPAAAQEEKTVLVEEKTVQEPAEETPMQFIQEEAHLLDVVARYLAGHLKEDIRKGMDISLEDLYTLLDVCKRMQSAAAEAAPVEP